MISDKSVVSVETCWATEGDDDYGKPGVSLILEPPHGIEFEVIITLDELKALAKAVETECI